VGVFDYQSGNFDLCIGYESCFCVLAFRPKQTSMQDGTYEIIKIIIGEGSIIEEWRLKRNCTVYFYSYEQEILRTLARNGCIMKYGNCIQHKLV